MQTIYAERAKVFKALCDEKRQCIIELLQSGEKCACVLLEHMDMPQSTLSYHMKILCESGIVEGRDEGKWTYYHISPEGRQKAISLLTEITHTESAGGVCGCCK